MKIHPIMSQIDTINCFKNCDIEYISNLLKQDLYCNSKDIIINEGDVKCELFVIKDGWAMNYKNDQNGKRHISHFYLPGDIIGYSSVLYKKTSSIVEAITPVTYNSFPCQNLFKAIKIAPCLAIVLSWLTARKEKRLSEHIYRITTGEPYQRIAHLFCELNYRLKEVGKSDHEARVLPFSQSIIADYLGISLIHSNRSFKNLVDKGLVTKKKNKVLINDIDGLCEVGHFDQGYLSKQPIQEELTDFSRTVKC